MASRDPPRSPAARAWALHERDSDLGGQQPQRFAIVIAGARENVGRQMRRGRLLVPVQRFQIVAYELLVETRRTDAGLIRCHRPEAGGVGGERLVDQQEIARLVDAEFELRVGDDDVAGAGVFARRMPDACSLPTRLTTASKSMFSSCCPAGALYAGVNSGSGNRSAICNPGGRAMPQIEPLSL